MTKRIAAILLVLFGLVLAGAAGEARATASPEKECAAGFCSQQWLTYASCPSVGKAVRVSTQARATGLGFSHPDVMLGESYILALNEQALWASVSSDEGKALPTDIDSWTDIEEVTLPDEAGPISYVSGHFVSAAPWHEHVTAVEIRLESECVDVPI